MDGGRRERNGERIVAGGSGRSWHAVFPSGDPINRGTFCSETVQITAARTPMHVIMNGWRLFVSVPSAGNIGHFEFSIFNALVSPFGALLPLLAPASPNARGAPSKPFLSPRFFLPHFEKSSTLDKVYCTFILNCCCWNDE